jgi:Tol biopolymer transport system component
VKRLLLLVALVLSLVGCGSSSETTAENGPIVFTAPFSTGSGIFVREGEGKPRKLTDGRRDLFPTWSPDGQQIAFLRSIGEGGSHVYVMNADGGELHRVGSAVTDTTGLTWSPDGNELAFGDGITGGIYRISVDGTGLTKLTAEGTSPAWSPDGETIIFRNPPTLDAMNADGSHIRHLIEPRNSNKHLYTHHAPAWSPDGQHLLLVRQDILGILRPNGNRIVVVNPDGSGEREVAAVSFTQPEAIWPSWSPDGQQIAFAGQRRSRRGIWTVRSSGGTPHLLLAGDTYAMPSWGPART